MGVNLLPFIDRARLVKAMKKAEIENGGLSREEKERNKSGDIYLFFKVASGGDNESAGAVE